MMCRGCRGCELYSGPGERNSERTITGMERREEQRCNELECLLVGLLQVIIEAASAS